MAEIKPIHACLAPILCPKGGDCPAFSCRLRDTFAHLACYPLRVTQDDPRGGQETALAVRGGVNILYS